MSRSLSWGRSSGQSEYLPHRSHPTKLWFLNWHIGMRSFITRSLLVLATLSIEVCADEPVSFNRDVRPILSDKCFHCHGPDAENQDSSFRLDSEEHATEDLGGYAAVVPGRPEESELVMRVESADRDVVMPPPDAPRHLRGEEKQVLRRWIAEGGEYDQHWAFKKPERADVPSDADAIDYFVRERLQGTGLAPSQRASKRQLIRRVTLDLTGLPPTPKEVSEFLADDHPGAYGEVVDRLLASPAYGERMAEVWLDAARYADTAGYQNDFKRTQWPWRDWVIEAYNKNMPFDRFSIEQLAGDLLPDADDSTRLATAFNRNHRINNEGGIIPEEFLVEYVADRVETTSTVWLGLTTGCARCHDHKYDPIKMKDFYRLFAFFHNLPEQGKDGSAAPAPNMDVYTSGSADEHEQWKAEVMRLRAEQSGYAKKHQTEFQQWLTEQRMEDGTAWLVPAAHFPFDSPKGKVFTNLANRKSNGSIQGRERFVTSIEQGRFGRGVNFKDAGHVRIGKVLHEDGFSSNRPASWSFFVKPLKDAVGTVLSCQSGGQQQSGYQISLEESDGDRQLAVAFRLIADQVKGQLLQVQTPAVMKQPADEFTHVCVTYDGSHSAKGVQIFINGHLAGRTIVEDDFGDAPVVTKQDHLMGSGLRFAVIDELYFHDQPLSAEYVQWLAGCSSEEVLLRLPSRNPVQRAFLESKYFSEHNVEYPRIVAELKQAERRLEAYENRAITKVSIMEEMPQPRKTYLLIRGDYTQPDRSEVLLPQTFASLPPMTSEMPKNRLGLAMWLFHEDNPLTARVAVNRYWQMLFGSGLVKTPEDFGSQGAMPTHPQLLDWLAVEFRESGWDVKALLKRIVSSETYCQDSRADPVMIEEDPANQWLARAARQRLSAFALRDQALAVSGLLSRKIGGPPVMPYQPAGLWDEVSAKGFKYVVAEDEGLYRRSLYTFWRRTVPPPSMMNFDSAGREACTVHVTRTNTPLQAINLMNDPQFVEAARMLGQRMMKESDSTSPADRIARCSELVLSRPPSEKELNVYLAGYGEYLDAFDANPGDAREFVSVGHSKSDESLDVVQLATCSAVASVFLNLDEAVTKE